MSAAATTALRDLARALVERAGFGHGGERYTYEAEDRFGPTSAKRRPDEWVRTTCGYCSVGCGMLLGVRDGRAVAVQGDPDHPVNRGRLCPKGLTEHHTIHADGRLTTPRIDGRDATWDEALDHVATTFTRLIDAYGPESVAVLSTGQLVTEEFFTLGKLLRLGLRLSHYDGNTTLCMASAVSGYKMAFGSDGPPGAYEDFEAADLVVLFGSNVADNHPLLAPRLIGTRSTAGDPGRPPGDQDGDDRRPAPAGEAPHGHHPHQRPAPRAVRRGAGGPRVPRRPHRRRRSAPSPRGGLPSGPGGGGVRARARERSSTRPGPSAERSAA